MKRLISILWLMVVFTLLTACAGKPATTEAPPAVEATTPSMPPAETEAPPAGVTITFMTPPWGVPPNETLLNAFESETGINVEVISIPMDQLYSKVQVAASANQEPADVIFLTEEAPSFIVSPGFVQPLNQFIETDPEIKVENFDRVDFWTLDSKIYGLPSYVQLVMMDYNEAKLQEAGYTEPPKTWLELYDIAKEIKAKGVDQYPIAFGAIDWSWYLMSLSMGDPMFNEELNPVFSQEGSKARQAMTLLITFFTEELITPAMLSETTPHAIYMGGTGVFHQSWQGANAVMNNPDSSKQAPNVKYMLLPEEGYTWSLDAALGISKDSDNAEAAWKFIKWYVGEANQRAIFDAYGLTPAQSAIHEALNKEGKITGFDVIQAQAQKVHQLPRFVPWWGPWTTKVTEQLRLAIQGSITPDQAIDAIADEWNSLKSEYE